MNAAEMVLVRGEAHRSDDSTSTADVQESLPLIEDFSRRFSEAMDDDFNTALALAHLFDLVRIINRLTVAVDNRSTPGTQSALRLACSELQRLGNVLGLFTSAPSVWLEKQKHAGLGEETGMSSEEIEGLLRERQEARANRDFARSDQIREELAAKGILLLDSAQGTTWKRK
jgi:cysteinyl-tRNA synthetase